MSKLIAILTLEARYAVLAHRQHYAEHPDQHRGCLWCEDGRFSHWLGDCRNRYGDETADAVCDLYDKAYPASHETFYGPKGYLP